MRKRLKRKRRSCPYCKGHKMGSTCRWTAKDAARLRADERDVRDARMRGREDAAPRPTVRTVPWDRVWAVAGRVAWGGDAVTDAEALYRAG